MESQTPPTQETPLLPPPLSQPSLPQQSPIQETPLLPPPLSQLSQLQPPPLSQLVQLQPPLPQLSLQPPLPPQPYVTLGNKNGFLQYLPLRERFFKVHGNLKIVCQDGSLHWSSLLMSTWSRLAKTFFTEERLALAGEDKMVLMVPEVKVSVMKLVLQWSLEGQVNLSTHSHVGEVMWALQSLGNTAELSVMPKGQDRGGENDGIAPIDIGDEDVDNNPAGVLGLVSNAFSLNGNSVQCDFNQMNNGGDESISLHEKLMPMDHLSAAPNEPLPGEKEDEDEVMIIEQESSIAPDKSPRVLTTSELQELPQTRHQPGSRRKSAAKEAIKPITCLLCNSQWDSYNSYMDHLAMSHYKRDLVEKYIKGTGNYCHCPVCHKRMPADSRDNTWKAKHLGKTHGFILKVAQGDVRVQLETLRNRFLNDNQTDSGQKKKKSDSRTATKNGMVQPERPKQQRACNTDQTKSPHVSPPLKMNSNPSLSYDPPSFKCPLCPTVGVSKHVLRRHLATHHYCQEIMRAAGVSDLGALSRCPICQRRLVGSERVGEGVHSGKSAYVYLWHLGRKHGYLDKVMPREVAKKLC